MEAARFEEGLFYFFDSRPNRAPVYKTNKAAEFQQRRIS
jgi:hypothetical protein